ncbi:hypothetical protein BD779DRAFT_1475378 [Infundibulicybe gibba]|nr:hypothetical protein BD779DRAFT_1475378 [Infundibulicybe gibba]
MGVTGSGVAPPPLYLNYESDEMIEPQATVCGCKANFVILSAARYLNYESDETTGRSNIPLYFNYDSDKALGHHATIHTCEADFMIFSADMLHLNYKSDKAIGCRATIYTREADFMKFLVNVLSLRLRTIVQTREANLTGFSSKYGHNSHTIPMTPRPIQMADIIPQALDQNTLQNSELDTYKEGEIGACGNELLSILDELVSGTVEPTLTQETASDVALDMDVVLVSDELGPKVLSESEDEEDTEAEGSDEGEDRSW